MSRRHGRPLIATSAAIVAIVALVACASDDDADAPSASGGTTSTTVLRQPGAISDTGPTTSPASTVPGTPQTTGDVTQTVPVESVETLGTVPIGDAVDVGPSVSAEITAVERVDAEARLPGEVAGPALAITLRVENTGDQPLDLDAVTVNLSDAAGQVSAPLTGPPAEPMTGSLEPGDDAAGTYLFEFPDGRTEPLAIEVVASVDAPIVVFVGPIP